MKWNTTKPRKRFASPVRLRAKNKITGETYQGDFVWSRRENAWVECSGPDGLGLYQEDGGRSPGGSPSPGNGASTA